MQVHTDIIDYSPGVLDSINKLSLQNPTPMHHDIWIKACMDTLYPTHKKLVLWHEKNDSTAAVFLAAEKFPQRIFLAGSEELGEPADLLWQGGHAALDIAERLRQTRRALRFGHFPAASDLVPSLHTAFKGKGFVLSAELEGTPYILIDKSCLDPVTRFKGRYRSDVRRMRKKAEALGTLSFDIITPTPDILDDVFSEAIVVEGKGWKSRAGTSLLADEAQQKFYKYYAQLACEAGILKIAFLRINQTPIAMQMAVQCDGGFWLLKIGYDENYAKCSPGNLLMIETLRYAAEQGLSSYEFLGKSAKWTKMWTTTERENIRLRVYPYSFHGLAALLIDGTCLGWKRAKRFLSKN